MRTICKARRLHSPEVKQYPARPLCVCSMLKHAGTMGGREPDAQNIRRTKVCSQTVQPLTQLSAKTEPEGCKYPTALIDKERSSDNTV